MDPTTVPGLLLVTADPALLERVLAVTATLGVEPRVLAEVEQLRSSWNQASLVLVGGDAAPEVAGLVLPPRGGTLLVGLDHDLAATCAWSVPLGAPVLGLPSGTDALVAALTGNGGGPARRARLLAVVGGAGGVGASTVAAGLAVVAARAGHRSALVEVDEQGGGLDLLVGAEAVEGWRWPRFAGARGFLGDLSGQLPHSDGVDVVAVARDAGPEAAVGVEQLRSVLLSLGRTHDVVVADLPRTLTPPCREALRQADEVLLVVRADLRGVAAARAVAADLTAAGAAATVLVRESRLRGLDAEAVADALGLPGAGRLAFDAGLPLAAERGDPPGRSARSPLARSCRQVLQSVLPGWAAA